MIGDFFAKRWSRAFQASLAFPLMIAACRPLQMESFEQLTGRFSGDFGVREIDAVTLRARRAAGLPTLLVDVRTKEEQSVSVIPGAVRLDPKDDLNLDPALNAFVARASGQADAMIVVYCAGGYRSARSLARYRARAGIAARNLRGGIIAYANAGGELADPASGQKSRRVHGYNAFWAGFIATPNEATLSPAIHLQETRAP